MSESIARLAACRSADALVLVWQEILSGLFSGEIEPSSVFSREYVQSTDGHELDFSGFLDHLRHVRRHVHAVRFRVLDACFTGALLAERHVAEIHYLDGRFAQVEVFVFARIEDGRVVRLDELTRVLSGNEDDQALARAVA